MTTDESFSVPGDRQSLGGSRERGSGARLLRDWLRARSCTCQMTRAVHTLAEERHLRSHGASGKECRRSEMDWRFSGIKGDRKNRRSTASSSQSVQSSPSQFSYSVLVLRTQSVSAIDLVVNQVQSDIKLSPTVRQLVLESAPTISTVRQQPREYGLSCHVRTQS